MYYNKLIQNAYIPYTAINTVHIHLLITQPGALDKCKQYYTFVYTML